MRSFATWYSMPFWSRMGFGVAAAIGGGLLRLAVMDQLGNRLAFLTLYPVVEVAALFGGVVSGGVAAILSALLAHFWIHPAEDLADWIGLGFFLLSATLLSLITEALHAIWKRLVVAEAQSVKEDELKKFQAARIETMKLLAAGFAHEIRQPLAATSSYLMAGRRLLSGVEQPPANVGEVLAKADAELGRAVEVVMRLRELIVHGKPKKDVARLHELIQNAYAVANLAELLELQATLRLNAEQDDVLVDAVQIEQVLFNILRNAAEAMSVSDKKELIISTSSDKREVRVEIADNGVGFSKQVKRDLFEPFQSTKEDGMGVGLMISHAIIDAHDGKMWAESNPEGGAIFSFTLPLAGD